MLMAQRKPEYYDDKYISGYGEVQSHPSLNKIKATSSSTKSPSKKALQSQRYKIKTLSLMLVIIGIFGLIGAKTVEVTIVKGAEISSLEKEIQALSLENDLLQVEVDKLRSVARIEEVALAMGMEKPEGTIYIASDLMPTEEKTVGVEQSQQTAAVQTEDQVDSVFDKVFKVFTSFFASTQR